MLQQIGEAREKTRIILRVFHSGLNWEDKHNIIFRRQSELDSCLAFIGLKNHCEEWNPSASHEDNVRACINGITALVQKLDILEWVTKDETKHTTS